MNEFPNAARAALSSAETVTGRSATTASNNTKRCMRLFSITVQQFTDRDDLRHILVTPS